MSFCCGASRIGAMGSMRHFDTVIRNVPLVFCPVCHRVDVHYLIVEEYALLAEFAHVDQAAEVDFSDFVEVEDHDRLFANCVNHDEEDPLDITLIQIDMALDLLLVAKQWEDAVWEQQLINRLGVLNKRRNKLVKQHTVSSSR